MTRPPKTPENSSKRPSTGQKPNAPAAAKPPPRKSRPGTGRALHPDSDWVVDSKLAFCPAREAAFPEASQARSKSKSASRCTPSAPT